MNRTFKVAKSLTRGTVVTSEKASSYQGKAVKTVVAAAVAALVAGTAMAAEETSALEIANKLDITAGKTLTVTQAFGGNGTNGIEEWVLNGGELSVKNTQVYHKQSGVPASTDTASLTINSGKLSVTADKAAKASIDVNQLAIKGGEVTLTGYAEPAADDTAGATDYRATLGAYGSFAMTGGTVTINKAGMLWYSSDVSDDGTMKLSGGTINLAGGKLAAGDKTNADKISLEGTNVNVTAASTIQAAVVEQSAGTLSIGEKGALTVKVRDGATHNVATTYKLSGGNITIAEGGTLDVQQSSFVVSGGTVDNSGLLKTTTLSVEGATVNTAFTKKNFEVGTVNLKKGVLNLAALNFRVDGKTITEELPGDRLLLNNGTWNLAGGELQVAGKKYEGEVKIGRSDEYATVNVTGVYTFDKVSFGSSNKVTDKTASKVSVGSADAAGSLTINDLDLTNGAVEVANKGTLTVGKVSAVDKGTVKNEGTIETAYANLVKEETADGTTTYTATAFGTLVSGNDDSGKLQDSSVTDTVSLEKYRAIASKLGNKFTFTKANFANVDKDGKETKLDLADIGGKAGPTNFNRSDVVATYKTGTPDFNGTTYLNHDLVIGSLEVVKAEGNTKKLTSLTIGNETTNTLTLRGNKDGRVIIGAAEDNKPVEVTFRKVNLGAEETDSGTIENAVKFTADSAVTGTFTLAGGATVNSTVTINNGALDAAWYEGTGSVTIADGTFAVLGNKPVTENKPAATAENPAETPTFTNAVKVQVVTFDKTNAKNLGVLSIGASSEAANAAVAGAYDETDGKSVIYLAKQAVFGNAATALTVGDTNQATDILVDVAGVAGTTGFAAKDGAVQNGLTVASGKTAAVKLLGVLDAPASAYDGKAGAKTFKLASSATENGLTVDYGTMFYGTSSDYTSQGTVAADGTISFVRNENYDELLDYTYQGGNAKADLDAVQSSGNQLTEAVTKQLTGYIAEVKASKAYTDIKDAKEQQAYLKDQIYNFLDQVDAASVMAVVGGVFSTTLDVNDQVTGALERRTSLANLNAPRTTGFTPWVDVFGTTNEGKRVFGDGMGYEADIYGAVLGFDYTAACGGVLGLAVNAGQADANSVGLGVAKVDNDSDFYGVSIYGAQTFGDFNVKADFGYTQLSNDLSTNTVFGQVKESQDADVLTFGVGAEYLVKFGSVNVVPHAGLRVSRISVDDSKFGATYDDLTVYQLPLGVAFSGTFDTNGWKVAPTVDVTFVPTFGDKDAEYQFVGASDSVRVFDSNPVRATLGVAAQKDAWTFGVNYGLTAGSDDRLNNAFNANVRYSF